MYISVGLTRKGKIFYTLGNQTILMLLKIESQDIGSVFTSE